MRVVYSASLRAGFNSISVSGTEAIIDALQINHNILAGSSDPLGCSLISRCSAVSSEWNGSSSAQTRQIRFLTICMYWLLKRCSVHDRMLLAENLRIKRVRDSASVALTASACHSVRNARGALSQRWLAFAARTSRARSLTRSCRCCRSSPSSCRTPSAVFCTRTSLPDSLLELEPVRLIPSH